jgi:hypothetical protein
VNNTLHTFRCGLVVSQHISHNCQLFLHKNKNKNKNNNNNNNKKQARAREQELVFQNKLFWRTGKFGEDIVVIFNNHNNHNALSELLVCHEGRSPGVSVFGKILG